MPTTKDCPHQNFWRSGCPELSMTSKLGRSEMAIWPTLLFGNLSNPIRIGGGWGLGEIMPTTKVCPHQIFKFPACPLLSMTSKSGGVQWQFDRHWFTRLTSVWLSPSNSIAGFVLLVIRDNPYNAWLTKTVQNCFLDTQPHCPKMNMNEKNEQVPTGLSSNLTSQHC